VESTLTLTHDDIVSSMRKAGVKTPIIVLAHSRMPEHVARALGRGADDYIPLPFHKDELVARMCTPLCGGPAAMPPRSSRPAT
jgi:DNA-binding response OmpR family regulator